MLDVLVRLDELYVELHSDGRHAYLSYGDEQRVPQDLVALVRSCSHRLAKMMGDTKKMRFDQ
jgi:hypothetical protein